MIYKCGPNVLANKFKTQMINAHVQIYNLMQIDVVMGRVDQSFKISEHITLKKKLVISKHSIHIPFIDLHSYFEVTNTSFSCAKSRNVLPLTMPSLQSTSTKFPH